MRFPASTTITRALRREVQERLDGGMEGLALRLDQDRLATAKQRHRIGFVGEPERVAREFVAGKPRQLKRVFRIVDRLRHDLLHAFGNQAGVTAEDEKNEHMRRRAGQKTVGFIALDRDHLSIRCGGD